MENKPLNSPEDDDDDDLEKEDSKESQKSSKVSRVPLTGAVEAKPADAKSEKPRLSLGEKLLETMGSLPFGGSKTNEKVKDDNQEKSEDTLELDKTKDTTEEFLVGKNEGVNTETDVEDAMYTPTAETPSHDTSNHDVRREEKVETNETPKEDEPKTSTLEAAEWESEGDFGEDGEIPLWSHASPTEKEPIVKPALESSEESPEPLVEEDLLETGLGSEGPPEPPEPPETLPDAGDEGEPDFDPRRMVPIRSSVDTPWYDAAAADRADRINHEKELSDTAYYAEKHGLSRGLTAGLLFGWMFGKRGKKKQAEAFTKELKSKDKQINALSQEQVQAARKLDALKSEQLRSKTSALSETIRTNGSQEYQPKRVDKYAEVAAKSKLAESVSALKELPKTPHTEKAKKIAEIMPISSVVEKARANVKVFEAAEMAIETAEVKSKIAKNVEISRKELAPEDRTISEEDYEVQAGRRVETSAWHRIEIDEKTGKTVDNPEVAYGEEFKQERAKEVWREDQKRSSSSGSNQNDSEYSSGSASKLGGLATSFFGASSISSDDPTNATVSNSNKPKTEDDEHLRHLEVGSELLHLASSPLVWLAAVIVVVLLFVVGVLR